jgi:hypothetical protein
MKLDNTLPIKKLRGHYYQGGQDEVHKFEYRTKDLMDMAN